MVRWVFVKLGLQKNGLIMNPKVIVTCESLCAIWYHLHNFKNVKNTHVRVLLLVKWQASACNFTKSDTLPWVFFMIFLNCKNGTKEREASLKGFLFSGVVETTWSPEIYIKFLKKLKATTWNDQSLQIFNTN